VAAKDLTNFKPPRIAGISIPDALKLWRFDLYSKGEPVITNGSCFAFPKGEGLMEATLGVMTDDSSWQLVIPYKVSYQGYEEIQGPIGQGDKLVLKSPEGSELQFIVSSAPFIYPGSDFIMVSVERGRL